jgi:hypothetical protein
MKIEYVITADDAITGDPVVPGYGDEFFAWSITFAMAGLWRSISITQTHADEPPPASRGSIGGIKT